jgi:L-2-hydroxyglutarate oxidase LhgO
VTNVDRADAVVIGAGVVGLAIARGLALAGREVIVIEANELIGGGISSRNSEVIHAGIYYRTGSRKARLCTAGREMLYRFCAERGIPHRRCGKLIVATGKNQVSRLHELRGQAYANGVRDLELLSAAEIAQLEPAIHGTAALLSPSTGIVDSHALMLALQADTEGRGGLIALSTRLLSGRASSDGIVLRFGGREQFELKADLVVNSAGLDAQAVSRSIDGLPGDRIPRRRLAKGSYYVLNRAAPFRRLVYPVPEPGGLGIHATLDLGGQIRFGPDVQWIDTPDYSVTEAGASRFYPAVRSYWPQLEDGALAPGYAGIRPKIVGPGEPDGDFLVHGPEDHRGANVFALYGIESPGLTASLAIAEEIVTLATA